jgi:DNA-binding NarL/FixJ family response regulator
MIRLHRPDREPVAPTIADAPTPIRVLLVDDHAVVRYGLATALGAEPDIDVVGEASDGEEAVHAVDRLEPDVVVMDVSMAGVDGEAATRRITRRDGARPAVLVLSMHAEAEYLLPMLDAGAAGYLPKSAASRELSCAVRTVARGEPYVRPEAAPVLARGRRTRAERDQRAGGWEQLSGREQDVLRLFAEGYTPAQIGAQLCISPKTVDTYRRRVNEKLGLDTRADDVRFALDLGLLAPARSAQ